MSDEHLRAALEHTAAGLRAPLEASLRGFADDLLRQAAAERERAAREAAEAAAADVRHQADAQLSALRLSADQQLGELRRTAQEQIDSTRQALEAELAVARDAQHQTDAARRALEAELADARDAQHQVEAARRALEAELTAAQVARHQIDAAHHALEEELAATRRGAEREVNALREKADVEIEDARRIAQAQVEDVQRTLEERLAATRRELEDARRAVDDTRRMLEDTRHGAETLRRQLDRAHSEMAEMRVRSAEEAQALVAVQLAAASESHQRRLTEGIDRARSELRDLAVGEIRTLLESVRAIDEARSLGEVLDRLVQIHRRDVERLVVFVVTGDRLREWRAAGFPEREPSERMDVGITEAGVAGEAVRTGRAAVRVAEEGQTSGGFLPGADGRAAAALPVTISGAVVAVLHVDAPRPEPFLDARWPAIFEVLARHASRALEAITIQRAAGLLPPAGAATGRYAGRSVQ